MIADVLANRRRWHVECGDALTVLRTIPDGVVHCVATSPPFYSLRDYQTATWVGGDPACTHAVRPSVKVASSTLGGGQASNGHAQEGYAGDCRRCGATRVDQQIGLEPTLDAYVAALVAVFVEVRRVLHPSGTLWLNLGDSYAGSQVTRDESSPGRVDRTTAPGKPLTPGYKSKDLLMVPARVALALQADGWWLRSDIVWAKTACMPESVQDRPTSAHEHVFLLAKQPRYYFDQEAVREPHAETDRPQSEGRRLQRMGRAVAAVDGGGQSSKGIDDGRVAATHQMQTNPAGRNMRNVWTLGPEPLQDDHFAAFPTEIPRRAILAGTSARGVCPACGNPWRRVVERENRTSRATPYDPGRPDGLTMRATQFTGGSVTTLGWAPSCTHDLEPIPALTLDPFSGSGRTVLTALNLGRRAVGIELSSYQAAKSRDRIVNDKPLFNLEPEAAS